MSKDAKSPFHSFVFTIVQDRRPRAHFRMREGEPGLYELHVEKGSASNPTSQFTRAVPLDVAVKLRDSLQEIGVFGWDEAYGDTTAPGSVRWSVQTVFQEGVFSVASKGGSDVPAGFSQLLEELYRLDFPRPHAAGGQSGASQAMPGVGTTLNALGQAGLGNLGGLGGRSSLSAGDLGAYGAVGGIEGMLGAAGIDFSQLGDALGAGGVPGMDAGDISRLFADAQGNPAAFQQRMREEFGRMSRDEQEQMLDALASTGMASRAWWERFLRG